MMQPTHQPGNHGLAAGEQPGLSAAAFAQSTFAEAAGMLREFTGGASLLQVEWELIQQLARQAAQLMDDLPATCAADLEIILPRRWWEPPWTADQLDPRLSSWLWRRTIRKKKIEQVFITGTVEDDPGGSDEHSVSFNVDAYLLAADGTLRYSGDFFSFPKGQYPTPPLTAGTLGPNDPRWDYLFRLGAAAHPVELAGLGIDATEQLLKAFAELGAATRDALKTRIGQLHQAGGSLPAGARAGHPVRPPETDGAPSS
jgi:hypothetical protein